MTQVRNATKVVATSSVSIFSPQCVAITNYVDEDSEQTNYSITLNL